MWDQIRSNRRKTAVLIVLMAALLMTIGYVLAEAGSHGAGPLGFLIAFVVWFILTLISYYSGDSIFLTLSGARKINPQDHQKLYNVIEEMKIASGLPKIPDVYLIDDPAPNAFATGRSPDKASLAVTSGLLELLDRSELQGVIGHEMGHIVNRDILYTMMVGTMMGAIVMLSDFGSRMMWGTGRRRTSNKDSGQLELVIMVAAILLVILAPLFAQLIYYAVSRRREYLADASSALFTRYPEGLASALEKISTNPNRLHTASRATAPLYIVNPMKLSAQGLSDVSSTHPPTSQRIQILRSMAGMGGGASFKSYDESFRKVTKRTASIIPAVALAAVANIPIQAPAKSDNTTPLERHRETTDTLWKLNDYVFIKCGCGTNLKVPPSYKGQVLRCPHCNASHEV